MSYRSLPRVIGATAAVLLTAATAACTATESATEPNFSAPTQLAEPGTTVPEVEANMGLSPNIDELIMAAGVERGYLDDVGITLTPKPYGAETDLLASLTPLLNEQIELGSGYAPSIVPQLDNVEDVVVFAIQDVFYGYRILAPEGEYKTVEDLMSGGESYEEAVTEVLAQVTGQKVLLRDGVVPTFYNLAAETAGTSIADWKISYLPNPDIVRAAQAGRADFVSPTGAAEIVRLQQNGWEPILEVRQVINNMPDDKTLGLRSTFSGYLTTREYAEENWETILRMTSVMYRLIDDVEDKTDGVARDFVDYVNSYTGSKLTAEELAATFDGLYSVRNFEDAAELYTDPSGEYNFDKVAGAQIDELASNGVISEGHGPGSLSIAKDVYEALATYKEEAEKLLGNAGSGKVWGQAREFYKQRNYLDAYRFAASAAGDTQ